MFNYKLNCGQYVLHDGDKPIGRVLDEVAIVFVKEFGTLRKHGDPQKVQLWLEKERSKLRASGLNDLADSMVMITGRFDLDELNRCLTNSGYALKLFKRLMAGESKPLPSIT